MKVTRPAGARPARAPPRAALRRLRQLGEDAAPFDLEKALPELVASAAASAGAQSAAAASSPSSPSSSSGSPGLDLAALDRGLASALDRAEFALEELEHEALEAEKRCREADQAFEGALEEILAQVEGTSAKHESLLVH